MEKERGRLTFVEIAKGICILLVVLGHGLNKDQGLHQYIYSIHIPTFIVLSGFFEKRQDDYLSYMKKNFKRLYLPFAFFVLVDYIAVMINYKTTFPYFVQHVLLGFVGLESVYNGPIWFLFNLFVVKALFQVFHRVDNNRLLKFVLAAVVILGFSYMFFSDYYVYVNRLWPIYALIPMLTYYTIGFLLKNIIKTISETFNGEVMKDKILLAVIMVMCFTLLIPTSQLNGVISFFGNRFNNAFAFLFNSIVGAFGVIILSCILSTFKRFKLESLPFFGRHSLFIQVTHYYLVIYVLYALFEKYDLVDVYYSHIIELLVFVLTMCVCTILIIAKDSLIKRVHKIKVPVVLISLIGK